MRWTVRTRLTLVYGGVFMFTVTALLVTVNLLLKNMLEQQVADIEQETLPPLPPSPSPSPFKTTTEHTNTAQVATDLSEAVQRFQWDVAAVTIIVLAALSAIGGWWLAGRILRPLHRITATAQRLSMSNLHERIALAGPDDELKELGDTFDAMLERLDRSVDSQRRFVANASHELRTPLAIQRAAIQIGLDHPAPEKLEQVRADLLAANERTERLIDGLLVLAQSEHGLEAHEQVRLDEIVCQAADDVPSTDVALEVDAQPVMIAGDPTLLTRLVANLLDNAVIYNRPSGTVNVTLTANGALTVTNTGPGVPPERVDELFQPFRRLRGDQDQKGAGAGLGLSIVATIAEAHGADLVAQPSAGGGLEVTVRFDPLDRTGPLGSR